jgi:hypothetical protein
VRGDTLLRLRSSRPVDNSRAATVGDLRQQRQAAPIDITTDAGPGLDQPYFTMTIAATIALMRMLVYTSTP